MREALPSVSLFPKEVKPVIIGFLYQKRFDITPYYRSNVDDKDLSKRFDIDVRIYLAGEYDVGKTALRKRWAKGANDTFPSAFDMSSFQIFHDIKYMDYNDKRIRVRVEDPTGNNDRYGRTIHSSCHGTNIHALLYCYDATNKQSLMDVITWRKRFFHKGVIMPYREIYTVLVELKSDCSNHKECNQEDIRIVMEEMGIDKHFGNVSSKENTNVEELFDDTIKYVVDYLVQRSIYPFYG